MPNPGYEELSYAPWAFYPNKNLSSYSRLRTNTHHQSVPLQPSPQTPKQPPQNAVPTTTTTSTMSPGLIPDPFLQERAISELPAISDLSTRHGLAGIKAQQSRDASDHVRHPQPSSSSSFAAHDIRGIELDGAKRHAALALADAGLHEGGDEGGDDATRAAPGRRPQREERRPRRRAQELVCVQVAGTADAGGGGLAEVALSALRCVCVCVYCRRTLEARR